MNNSEWEAVLQKDLGSLSYLDRILQKSAAAPDGQNWPQVLMDKVDSELEELDENLENRSKEYVKDKSLEIFAKRNLAALISLGFFTKEEMISLAKMYRPLENCYTKFLERKPEMLMVFQNSIRDCAGDELRKESRILSK